ncbi:MAG: 16S rRNA (cytidine(1402)-2'-O)-methyltransferase [Snowella sp.]|nr:16S rRNA (cytidine(1402)-2'-O)-methyltransferase [Snowella sp.]
MKVGTLYLVGTPIGNLEDMTFRAIETLKKVDLIAAEDTRHTGKLLQYFKIETPQISYHDHNHQSRLQTLLNYLNQGQNLALVTDAGMPGISDPGYELVQACLAEEIAVIPIPGVTALITALVASGLPTDRFIFEGFLPTKSKERQARLQALQTEPRTILFYEAPHRLLETITDLSHVFGPERSLVTARELTKLHEEFWYGTLGKAIEHYTQVSPKGEFTLVVGGQINGDRVIPSDNTLKTELEQLLEQGMSRSQASRHLAELTQVPRRHLYQLALNLGETD